MSRNSGPNHRKKRQKRWGLFGVLLFSAMTMTWLDYGPHRRATVLILEEAAEHGFRVTAGSRKEGWLSTTLADVRASLGDAPGLSVEMAHVRIDHGPFTAPHISLDGVTVHVHGDPVTTIQAVATAWFSPSTRLDVSRLQIIFEHRLGTLRLGGVALEHHGDAFAMTAEQAHLGDLVWRDARLSFEPRPGAVAVGFASKAIQLTCFPSERGTARWLFDVPHGPLRPLLQRLGLSLGEEFAGARGAGSLSLDIPDDQSQPVRGRVQMVFDDWPLDAPAAAAPMLGRTFSLLSNLVASADGARWDLPRVELTMPVFSLAGPGSLQLGPNKRLVLAVEGERTCQQLRGLLPPGKPLDEVQRFIERMGNDAKPSARLEIRWDTRNPKPLQPGWHFTPGCGLAPWSTNP